MTEGAARLRRALLAVDRTAAVRLIEDIGRNDDSAAWLESQVSAVLEDIGEQWERGELALAQVYMAGRIAEDLLTQVLGRAGADAEEGAPVAIVTFQDFHLLGKRIVYSALRASGIAVRDYGRMEIEPLLRRVEADGIQMLLVSTLMLPAALAVKDLKQRLPQEVQLVVGGAPFRLDPQLWREVGADAVGRNSADAVKLVREHRASSSP